MRHYLLLRQLGLLPTLTLSGRLLLLALACDNTDTGSTLEIGAERTHPLPQYMPEKARRNVTLELRESGNGGPPGLSTQAQRASS